LNSKVIFLDRDGVINKRIKKYVTSEEEFELIPNVEKWLKILAENGFKLIIVTNQSMIGRELSTVSELEKIHKKMQSEFRNAGFQIDKIYYCPHKPEENCFCRKPNSKLFEDAISDFSIDVEKSWIIGDEDSDVAVGEKIGCKTIKVETNSELQDAVSQIIGKNF